MKEREIKRERHIERNREENCDYKIEIEENKHSQSYQAHN